MKVERFTNFKPVWVFQITMSGKFSKYELNRKHLTRGEKEHPGLKNGEYLLKFSVLVVDFQ